jgi:hypothetical protein
VQSENGVTKAKFFLRDTFLVHSQRVSLKSSCKTFGLRPQQSSQSALPGPFYERGRP